jgi:anti-sigma-K factor RskA
VPPANWNRKPLWKLLGLAGLAGVAATGAVLARNERQRRAYTPDDVRSRLHERHATLAAVPEQPEPEPAPSRLGRLRHLLRRGCR